MSRLIILFLVAALASSTLAAENPFNFTKTPTGQAPKGFRSTVLGGEKPSPWQIVTATVPSKTGETKQSALVHLGEDADDSRLPLLICESSDYRNFTFTVRFQITGGRGTQAAGIAFRMVDEKNFYLLAVRPKDRKVFFTIFKDGEAKSGLIGENIPLAENGWQELTFTADAGRTAWTLNGRSYDLTLDPATAPIFLTGKVAFWTRSDTRVQFTEPRVTAKEALAQIVVRETLDGDDSLTGLRVIAAAKEGAEPRVIASHDEKAVGSPAEKTAKDALLKSKNYYLKTDSAVTVSLPLRDKNGDTIAAAQVITRPSATQTEQSAVNYALKVVKKLESRLKTAKDLAD